MQLGDEVDTTFGRGTIVAKREPTLVDTHGQARGTLPFGLFR